MAQELSKYIKAEGSNLPAISNEAAAAALQETADIAGTGSGGVDYLRFSGKTGAYTIGQRKETPDPDQVYLVEPLSVIEGHVCWKASKAVDRFEWSIYRRETDTIHESELDDHGPYRDGEGWAKLVGFGMASLADGAPVKFSVNSKSGRNALGDLIREIGQRMANQEPDMALLTLGAETFVAQDQKNYKPVLDVITWTTRGAVEAYFDGDMSEDDLLDGEQPKKKRGKRAKK